MTFKVSNIKDWCPPLRLLSWPHSQPSHTLLPDRVRMRIIAQPVKEQKYITLNTAFSSYQLVIFCVISSITFVKHNKQIVKLIVLVTVKLGTHSFAPP